MSKAKTDVVSDLCGKCSDPGRCCRGFFLSLENKRRSFKRFRSKAAVIKKLRKSGLPFMPRQRYRDGCWRFDCSRLTAKGRCSDYKHRPYACRVFRPGEDMICPTTIAQKEAT